MKSVESKAFMMTDQKMKHGCLQLNDSLVKPTSNSHVSANGCRSHGAHEHAGAFLEHHHVALRDAAPAPHPTAPRLGSFVQAGLVIKAGLGCSSAKLAQSVEAD